MSYQQQNGLPHHPSSFGPHGMVPHENYNFETNKSTYQQPTMQNGQGFNLPQNHFPPQNNYYPQSRGNYPPQGYNQQQYHQQPEPESCHEHPLNFEGRTNDNCKLCLKRIGESGGYKCKECPIVLCLDCSQRIFYGNKKKHLHPHDLLLQDRNSWTCDKCKTSYMDNASFYCQKCDFDICEKCYLENNKPQMPFEQPFQQTPPQNNTQPYFQQSQQPYPQSQQPYPQSQQPYPQSQQPYPQSYPQSNGSESYPQQQPYPQPPPFSQSPMQEQKPYSQPPFQQPYPQSKSQFPQQKEQYLPGQTAYSQQQGPFQPQGAIYEQQNGNYTSQDYYQPYSGYQQNELNPESEHEHPFNYEENLNEKCKLCLNSIGGKEGYKCKDCPVVLCINCSDRIFYGSKKKSLHNHELFLRDRNSWRCNICKKSYKENVSFNCKQCDFDVCDECFIEKPQQDYQNQQKGYYQPQYPAQQEPGYAQTQPQYPAQQGSGYSQTQGQDFIEPFHEHPLDYEERLNDNCKICEQKIGGKEGYKCKVCSLVLCLDCINNIYYGQKKKSLHSHDLILQNRSNWKCNICKKKKGNASFYCTQCDFDVCVECFIEKPNQGFNNIYQNNYGYQQEKYLEKKISAHEHPLNYESNLNVNCKLCSKKINNKEGYKCKTKNCSFALCFDCSNKIINKTNNQSIHNHDLLLQNRPNWRCNLCKIIHKNKPTFYCKKCDFDCCPSCYLKNN